MDSRAREKRAEYFGGRRWGKAFIQGAHLKNAATRPLLNSGNRQSDAEFECADLIPLTLRLNGLLNERTSGADKDTIFRRIHRAV